jgi:translation initiation factor 3 subunit J
MTDNWDDSDDEWDVDDSALDAKLGIAKPAETNFDDEEDLALAEKQAAEKANNDVLKKKGSALAARKKADEERQLEVEVARKELEYQAEMEAKMTPDELRAMERRRVEEADHALTDDLFGAVEKMTIDAKQGDKSGGDKLVLKDMKDHMKHARKVATCMKVRCSLGEVPILTVRSRVLMPTLFLWPTNLQDHGKVHLAGIFLKEVIQQSTDVLDDNTISDIIKTCNVIKNEMVQQAKKKVKGQAQKSKKQDKAEKVKAKKLHDEVFGDNDMYDDYDAIGDDYEDAFF